MSISEFKINEKYNGNINIKKFIIVYFMLLITFFVVGSYIIQVDSIVDSIIIRDINGINLVIGLFAVLCCGMYYYIYKSDEFFIFILSFISIYIEVLVINISTGDYSVFNEFNYTILFFPYIYRAMLLLLAVFKDSYLTKKIACNKKATVIGTIFVSFGTVLADFLLKYFSIEIYNDFLPMVIIKILIILYFGCLICIGIRFIKQKEFIYLIMCTSLSLFNMRKIISYNIFNDSHNCSTEYCNFLALMGFLVLIIGLFLEIIKKVNENNKLNNKIKTNEIEVGNMKEMESLRSQFFANLSHEFKTPINIIYSCNQLLEKEKEKGAEEFLISYNKYDNTMKQNCYRMLRLVNNLVDSTKLDTGFFNMNFENYEIISLVENITLSIAAYIEGKDINIIFDTYIEEIEIKCDPESIERVVLNLLANAVKFSNVNGNIMVIMDSDIDWVTIKIKDDGIGIPNEFKKTIFDRFIKVDKSLNRGQEGSGLGLYIVKSIVDKHHGQIYLNQEVNEGSEFIIKLPNVKCEYNDRDDKKINNNESTKIIDKISIEFSDIYD